MSGLTWPLIAPIELCQESAHEARGLGDRSAPVVNPLALSLPLDQAGLGEYSQMTRDPRLALADGRGEIGNA